MDDGRTDGRTDGQTDGRTDGQTDGRTDNGIPYYVPSKRRAYKNDRGTLGGGVFVLVEKLITSVDQPSLITDGEIEWVKIKVKNNKDLVV